MSWLVPPRRPSREWLDDPSLPSDDMVENLRDIANVDRAWDGSGALARWLLAQGLSRGKSPTTVLDLGAGSGVPTRRLRRSLVEAGTNSRVFGLDLQWRHLAAGFRLDGREPLSGIAADAFRLPLPGRLGRLDRLDPPAPPLLAGRALGAPPEIRRVARRGFALLDLRRHRVPLAVVAVSGRFTFRSRVSVHDGIASVRQAYTPQRAPDDRLPLRATSTGRAGLSFPPPRQLLGASNGQPAASTVIHVRSH